MQRLDASRRVLLSFVVTSLLQAVALPESSADEAEHAADTVAVLEPDGGVSSAKQPAGFASKLHRRVRAALVGQLLPGSDLAPEIAAAKSAVHVAHVNSQGNSTGGIDTCVFAGGVDGHHQPFEFWQNGPSGRRYVQGKPDPRGSGLCVFPEADCKSGSCCSMSPWVLQQLTISDLLANLVALVLTLPVIAGVQIWRSRSMDELKFIYNGEFWDILNYAALYLGIFIHVISGVYMARWTQYELNVPERNAMMSAAAFLTPFQEVFQFLEDAVSVQIGYAVGANDLDSLGPILFLGVLGGIALGCIAAGLTTALSFWPAAMRALLAPGQRSLDECTLIPSPDAVVTSARGFWLLSSWSWPTAFASMALAGFLLGTREYGAFGMGIILARFVLIVTWLWSTHRNLNLLGWAGLLSSAVFAGFCLLVIAFYPPIRREYHLGSPRAYFGRLLTATWQSIVGADPQQTEGSFRLLQWKVIKYGLQAMVLDLSIQACMSSGVYLAAHMGLASLYQVSAMQAALPQYGPAVAAGIAYAMKIVGAIMVGRGFFSAFRLFVCVIVLASILFAATSVAASAPFRGPMAFGYAVQACVYASEEGCAGTYASIFGNSPSQSGTLQESFAVFPVAAASCCLLNIFKAGLYSCFDFAFMAKAGVAAFVFVYVPAACVALHIYRTPAALYLAMYSPVLALSVVFLIRLLRNAFAMARGEAGPWNDEVVQTSDAPSKPS